MSRKKKSDYRCNCGGVKAPKKSRCANCLDKAAASMRQRTLERRNAGLCETCGEPVKPGYHKCEAHLKRHASTKAALRQRRMEKGLCGTCGRKKEFGRADKINCGKCAKRAVHIAQEYQQKKRRAG